MSVSRLCFLPGGLPLRCTYEGLFPCFSADCLSGETGLKKIKFFNDDNTIALQSDLDYPDFFSGPDLSMNIY